MCAMVVHDFKEAATGALIEVENSSAHYTSLDAYKDTDHDYN